MGTLLLRVVCSIAFTPEYGVKLSFPSLSRCLMDATGMSSLFPWYN